MSGLRFSILVATLVAFPWPGEAAAPPVRRVDLHGDPLPAGALARMGTVRLRHGCPVTFVRFLVKDRELVTRGWDDRACVWDAATGRLLRQFGQEKTLSNLGALIRNGGVTAWKVPGSDASADISPDGRFLATGHNDGFVRVWELSTGKEVHQFTPAPRSPVWAVAFTSDGNGLITHQTSSLIRLWNPFTGRGIRQFGEALDHSRVRRMAVSPCGKRLAIADADLSGNRCVVRVWDVETGKEVKRIHWPPGEASLCKLAFSPDGNSMACVGDGRFDKKGTLVLYDVRTGAELHRIDEQMPPRAFVSGIDFSPDGRLLAGKEPYLPTVRIWDARSGKIQRVLDERKQADSGGMVAGGENSKDAAFSSDGKTLVASLANAVRLWDVQTGKVVLSPPGHEGVISSMAVSPDGEVLTTWGQDETVRRWEVNTGRELARFRLPGGSGRPVFDATARVLVFGNRDRDDTVRVWDVASGKETATLPIKDWFGMSLMGIGGLALSPDGKVLATKGYGPQISLWDASTGRSLGKVTPPSNPGGRRLHPYYPEYPYPITPGFVFSPDGATLLTVVGPDKEPPFRSDPSGMALSHWDVRSGKEIRRWDHRPHGVAALAFAPDGRTAAAANTDHTISLWEMATGKERLLLKAGALCVAFSPDGRRFAAGCIDRVLRVWAVPEGELLAELQGHFGDMVSVAFAPRGRTVISAGWDTTALAWDLSKVTTQVQEAAGELEESLWADLAGEDAGRAYRAMGRLAASPAQAIPFVQKRLLPAKPDGSPDRIPRLVKDLDSDDFATREKASMELEQLGGRAEAALRNALRGAPSLELRRRAERLVARLEKKAIPPEDLRAMRSVEVLESIGTSEAVRLLRRLASGAPGARLTEEAKVALARLPSAR